jgi:hypothetical protein
MASDQKKEYMMTHRDRSIEHQTQWNDEYVRQTYWNDQYVMAT